MKPARIAAFIGCAALAAAIAAAAPAGATEYCDVLQSPDGFVALRAGPSASARLIARMHAGDEVRALEGGNADWMEVYFWHDGDRLEPARSGRYLHGWVSPRYIGECG